MKTKIKALTLAVALAMTSGCASSLDQALVVESVVTEAILPNLDTAFTAFDVLDDAVDRLCESPSAETLTVAREAWVRAKLAWEPAQPTTYFDPGGMLRTVSKVDYTPASPEGVDRLLASDTVIDGDYVTNNAASTQRGLGAIEHLLFRSEDPPDERECNLITAATEVAGDATEELREAWGDMGQGGFTDEFVGEMTNRQALADIVGAALEVLTQQTILGLGKAIGISAPDPVPDSIEEGEAGAGAAVYRAQLAGIESWLTAGEDTSFIELVRGRSDQVATDIEAELDAAFTELDAIEGSMEQLAMEDPDRLVPLYDHLDRLRTLLEADVVSLLDLTIGFSDSDGDSG